MLLSAILVTILATGSQWWFSHLITRTWLYPIWSGFLVGVFMGQPVEGMMAAAYIQLTYLGWITAGGSMPGNLMVAGIYGTALTLLSGADPKLAVSFAVTLSLLGILINQAYMTLNSFWVHRADRYLEQGNLRGVRLMNYVPSGILSFLLYGVPIFAMIMFGSGWAETALLQIPKWLVDALNLVGAMMPALGIAMLLNYLGKKKLIAFFFFGFFATVYLGLDTMSLFIFSSIIAAVMYFFGKDKAEEVA